MDIHPPHPIHSFKDFLIQILTITVGILIALGLEQGIEAVHNRHIVQEARTNIVAEMKANQHELETNLPKLKKNEQELRKALGYIQQLKRDPKANGPDLNLNLNFFGFQDTSWSTAQSTGALALMNYNEVQDLSFFYGLQKKLDGVNNELERSWLQMIAGLEPLNDDSTKFDRSELDDLQRLCEISLANLQAVENIGNALDQQYVKYQKSGSH